MSAALPPNRTTPREGFGRVELVVVVVVVGLFTAIIAPGVYSARENGRRTTCMCRMRNIGMALLCYEKSRRE